MNRSKRTLFQQLSNSQCNSVVTELWVSIASIPSYLLDRLLRSLLDRSNPSNWISVTESQAMCRGSLYSWIIVLRNNFVMEVGYVFRGYLWRD